MLRPQSTPQIPRSRLDECLEQQYDLIEQIGSGSFAEVWKAKKKQHPKQYIAIKKIQYDPLLDIQGIGELDRLKILRGDHIIQFYGYIIDNREINLLMKFCLGSLRDCMDQGQFSPNRVMGLIVQVTSAMINLSDKHVMHLDLKPENILYDPDDYFRICDFGCSQLFSLASKAFQKKQYQPSSVQGSLTDFGFGTQAYIAPQIKLGKNQIGKHSCDIWSFGIILYEIIYKKHPFNFDKSGKLLISQIKNYYNELTSLQFPEIQGYPIEIVKMMLRPKAKNRISWRKLKQHLIKNYKRQQAQFIDLQQAGKHLLKYLLVIANIIITIEDENQNNGNQFWKNNRKLVLQLKEILVYFGEMQILYFYRLFGYKIKQKLSQSKLENLSFMLESFREEKKKLEGNNHLKYSNNSMQQLEVKLKQNMKKLEEVAQYSSDKWESVKILNNFIKQSKQFQSLFCKGYGFPKTCQVFDIREED